MSALPLHYEAPSQHQVHLYWNAAQHELLLTGTFFQALGFNGLVIGGFYRQLQCFRLEASDERASLLPDEIGSLPEVFHLPEAAAWRDSFPADWISKAAASSHGLQMLYLACNHDDARKLLEQHPFILQQWCQNHLPYCLEPEQIHQALYQPLTRVAADAGLPCKKSDCKQLAKLDALPVKPADLANAMAFFNQPAAILTLRHIQKLDIQSLLLLNNFPILTDMPLRLKLYGMDKTEFQEVKYQLREITRMADLLPDTRTHGLLHNCRTINQLKPLHDALARAWNEELDRRYEAQKLEEAKRGDQLDWVAPWEAAKGMTPLANPALLLQEGKVMHHCIASYVQVAQRGEFFGWHLSYQGEQATIGIRRNFKGGWCISEIRTACNGKPSPELEKYVHDWAYHSEQKRIRRVAWQQVTRALRQREFILAMALIKGTLRLYLKK